MNITNIGFGAVYCVGVVLAEYVRNKVASLAIQAFQKLNEIFYSSKIKDDQLIPAWQTSKNQDKIAGIVGIAVGYLSLTLMSAQLYFLRVGMFKSFN